MPGNTDEKEKCLEKLNEMQKFLPFLDFMIDKIKKKNDLPLECQLSKFQHIRSVITEKNGKYGLESLYNIEDVLLKLISKLDYKNILSWSEKGFRHAYQPKPTVNKSRIPYELDPHKWGISLKEKKESVGSKLEQSPLPKGVQRKDEGVPEAPVPASAARLVAHDDAANASSSKVVDSSNNIVYMIMKSMKMTVVHSSRQDERKGQVAGCKDNKIDSVATGSEGNVNNLECPVGKSKDSGDVGVAQTKRKDADCVGNRGSLDVLASSRKKLLKSVTQKGYAGLEYETGSNKKKTEGIDSSKDNKDSSVTDSNGAKSIEGKEKNISVSDKFLIGELSDISDDEYIIAETVESDEKSKIKRESDRSRDIEQSSYISVRSRETPTRFDWKLKESLACSMSYPSDTSSKQKLRERLSADIAELHKVPGKSVGGSLRSLKDLKSSSQECEPQRKKAREKRSEHRLNSPEKLNDSERDRNAKKSSRKERRSKEHRNKNRGRRREEKRHHRSGEEKEDRSGHGPKHSSRSERKVVRLEEQGKEDVDDFDVNRLIDSFDDGELLAFVNENMSDLPNLSTMSPGEMRRAVRQSYTKENLEALTDDSDENDETSGNEMKDGSQRCSEWSASPKEKPEAETKINRSKADDQHADDDDDDEYSMRLIEEIDPNPKAPENRTIEIEPVEAESKWSVPELNPRENPSPAKNKDPRMRHSTNFPELQTDVGHHPSDPRIAHRFPKTVKSPTETSVPPRIQNDNCDPRVFWNPNVCTEKQSDRHYFQPQRYTIYDAGSNNPPRHHGMISEHARFPVYGNLVGNPKYNACEPKCYGEYKQMKRQEKECEKRLRLSLDDRINTTDSSTSDEPAPEAKSKQGMLKENEGKVKEPVRSPPPNKPNLGDSRNSKSHSPKRINSKPAIESHRKSSDGDRNQEERIDKSSTGRVSTPEEELVSPLDKLYDNDSKPVTGRGYGLQNFKIPKKGRSTSLDQSKTDENKPGPANDKRTNSSEVQGDNHAGISQECVEVEKDRVDKPVSEQKIDSEEVVSDRSQEQVSKQDFKSKDDTCEIETEKVNSDNSLCTNKEKSTVEGKIASNSQTLISKVVKCDKKEEADSFTPSEKICSVQIGEEKGVSVSKGVDNESEKVAIDKASGITNPDEKESDVKSNGESDIGNKSTITEEITQELVEALISKSFESGEGELLLAKAKLFKELALKLNSKKLKTIQKIINSESDSSSSSSRSSTESERKKKKMKKKIGNEAEKYSKKLKRERKMFKSKEYVDSSSEGDAGTDRTRKCKTPPRADKIRSEPASDGGDNREFPQNEGESPTKSKKSQRKTKLLEQIFNESPAKDFDLSMGNQNPLEKESDPKSKTKVRSKGKTELDRLHEDIRDMFISSGVVTATGQRMCRMLRESGGRMNNLDLVKESAKMVEEEKLASRRSKRLTNARSRSRSMDRKSVRDRSRSRSLVSGHGEDTSKVLNHQPLVVLERLNLQKMSYAYKITDVPESLLRRRNRNVARRGRGRSFGVPRATKEEEMYWNKKGRMYLARNLRRCLAKRSRSRKRHYKGKKLADIIEKLPLKMAKIRHLEIGSKEPGGSKGAENEQTEESEAGDRKQRGEYIVEESSEILDYAFERSTSAYSCLLCGHHTKAITAHYKTEHPESDVLISRLNKSEATKAVHDSKTFNYDITALEQACSLEMIKKRVKHKLTGPSIFFCRMCNYGNVTNISQFYSHVSSHTGEYRYKCPVEGCDLTTTSRDSVRNHVMSKHQKQKTLSNKAVELFPLPSEHGILFGYLCPRCNYVQVLKRNVESHIQKVHGNAEEVRAIKIDLSGKPPDEKETTKRTLRKKRRKEDRGERAGKDGNDDDEDFDPADEDYDSGAGSESSLSDYEDDDDDDDDEDFKSSANVNGDDQPRRTRSSALDDGQHKRTKETPASAAGSDVSTKPNANRTTSPKVVNINDVEPVAEPDSSVKVKQEVLREREVESDTCAEQAVLGVQKWTVGPLGATISNSEIITYRCSVGMCGYKTRLSTTFKSHVLSKHQSAVWTGVCASCDKPSQKTGNPSGIYTITDILEHLEGHIKRRGNESAVEKLQSIKKESNQSTDSDSSKPPQTNEDASKESTVFPQVPLLRVRSLVGDRLSKPKSVSEEEPVQPDSPIAISGSAVESDKTNSEPLFTIKDVRSLNPDTEDPAIEEITFQQDRVTGSFPPNAEVIAGKPVLIRSCPSPKITISSEPNPIPISVAQAKQGVEVGQLVKVVPPPTVTEVPQLGINQLGLLATTSIRILSPRPFATQAVIVPKLKTTSRLVSVAKTDTTPSVTVTQARKPVPKPIVSKTLIPPVSVGSDVVIQKIESGGSNDQKKPVKKKKPPAPSSLSPNPVTISPVGEVPPREQTSPAKKEQKYSVTFSRKNIKDANIYKEMLAKSKLCQLFKCMAVECSFTCNNETIFTQHIGLHEAQQRIKGKKKPLKKVKVFNWQQCAYCCGVLVPTGSALSQHILADHGHCLYQCAYCFYRAVSPTYVDLHQNMVHEKIIKEKKKLIYKCKPAPGAVLTKQFEKQIKPQHIRPYQCEHCGSKFLIIQHFFDHLTKQHQSVTAYTCHICKILCFKADRLIAHYKLHSYSMYQCAYCLHGTENQKEMLYHLWNFHFSQPPVIYARILEDQTSVRKRKILRDSKKKKSDSIALDDLKLITFDNEPTDNDHNLEEAGSEAEQEGEKKDAEPVPISIDLSAIVSELGIDVDDLEKDSSVAKGREEVRSEIPAGVSVETMLPNAQFSSESDIGKDNSTLLISSTLTSVISTEKKDEKDASMPIGQLPIELLEKLQNGSSQKQPDDKEKESVDKIIMNLQQKNSSVTVSPVVENKTVEEATPVRSLHKLPPTVPVNRSVIARVYQPKKVALVKKLDDGQVKDAAPLLFHSLCTTPQISTDRVQPQNVILAVPVVDSAKSPLNIHGKDDAGIASANQNVIAEGGVKRTGEESSDPLKKANDGSVLKRLCLGSTTSPAVITVSTLPETPLRISDVRSLSTEKPSPVLLQPPIIRVEDFAGKKEVSDERAKSGNPEKSKERENSTDSSKEKDLKPPSSPEVIILDLEEDGKSSRRELVEVVDSEDDADTKKETSEEETKKVMTDNDLEIRKQMEQLRNQMENETDCLLLDDDGTQDGNEIPEKPEKLEDSRSGFSTAEETNQTIPDNESTSLDSQQASEESSDKVVRCEGNTQDGDSRTNDSEDSKGGRTDDSQSASGNVEKESEIRKTEELSGKELYLCGNASCNFAAENAVELKDHLYICDYSRESTVLICPHCTKNFRHSAPYIEHLKRHGEKIYSCGLCDFLSAVESSLTQHLKKKHRCSQVKTLPNDSKPGHFVIYPKNYKKGKQDGEMNVYSPGDEDKLPLQSIYQDNVNCAKCPYFTKVRSNMVRHLKIHIKSVETEGSIVVPSTAPTNPVPCLDTKERMFDKMTNLAASSQMAQANKDKLETLSPEEEAKLPQFVPEQMRHKCCSPDCNYLTIDDNMLKHHIKALHDEINVYSCPHCRETVHLEFRYVPLDKIGQHLKYHDSRLYKCYHCTYFHHQKYVVEKHALEKHPERRFFVFTVREPKVESSSAAEEEQQQQHHPASSEPVTKMWMCGLCEKFESTVRMSVLEHLAKVHNMKSKFKCKFCDTKISQYSAFAAHFASKHNGQKVECLKALIRVNKTVPEGGQGATGQDSSNEHFDTTPLWQRDAPRIRHIRGILIEEEEIKTKKSKKISSDIENEMKVPTAHPPDMFYCPLCTDKKKVFRSKNSESFRTHLYQELNYQQYACILCGKMFVDRKDCERHHVRAHPNRTLSIKQTKEDSEIKFWVDKVVAKQQAQITERKRRMSMSDAAVDGPPAKKKKVQPKPGEPATVPVASPKKKSETNRLTRSNSSVELKTETDRSTVKRSSDDKTECVRQTRSGNAVNAEEPLKKCPHCSYKVNNLNSLKNHIKLRHLKMGKWLCSYCGDSFQLEKHATTHCRSSHPDEVPMVEPNPDEQVEELKDDFWLVEYGFGREKQPKQAGEGEKPPERCKPTATRRESTKSAPTQAAQTGTKPDSSNVYSCGYCMLEVTDQSSIVEHFETCHKNTHSDAHFGVVGTIYYQCNVCSEKLIDFESLNVHAKDKHANMTLQFEIRKVYKYDSKDIVCPICSEKRCECVKGGQTVADKAEDGCYQCPRCPVISTSYLDCIDHFNEHYPRYACSSCSDRFFTEAEIEKHQNEYKHKSPYAMTIPSENMLDEYKSGVKVKKNGVWQPLQASKRPISSDDSYETKKVKSLTARKSTSQVPDRKSHGESDSRLEDTEVSKSEHLHD